tara:strand:- start:343 stop:8403 length:8061 start_codon:yes stop_codon:yes gene_type:complete
MQRKDWWDVLKWRPDPERERRLRAGRNTGRRRRRGWKREDSEVLDDAEEERLAAIEEEFGSEYGEGMGLPEEFDASDPSEADEEKASTRTIGDKADLDALEEVAEASNQSAMAFLGDRYDDREANDWMKLWADHSRMGQDGDLGTNVRDMLLAVFLLGTPDLKGVDSLGRAYGGSNKFGTGREMRALSQYIKLTQQMYRLDPAGVDLVERHDNRTIAAQEKLDELPEDAPAEQREHLEQQVEQAKEAWIAKRAAREKYLDDARKSLDSICNQLGPSFDPEVMLGLLAKYYARHVETDDYAQAAMHGQEYFDADEWERHLKALQDVKQTQLMMGFHDVADKTQEQIDEHMETKYKMGDKEYQKAKMQKSILFRKMQAIFSDLHREVINPVITWNQSNKSERLLSRAHDIIEMGNLPNMWSNDLDRIFGVRNSELGDTARSHMYSSYNAELFNPQHYVSMSGPVDEQGSELPTGPLSLPSLIREMESGEPGPFRALIEKNPAMEACHATWDLMHAIENKDVKAIQRWIEHMQDPKTLDTILASSKLYQDTLTGMNNGLLCAECECGNHEPFLQDMASPFQPRFHNPMSDQQASELAGAPYTQSEGARKVMLAILQEQQDDRENRRILDKLEKKANDAEKAGDREQALEYYAQFDRLKSQMLARMSAEAEMEFHQRAPENPTEVDGVTIDFRRPPSFKYSQGVEMREEALADEGQQYLEGTDRKILKGKHNTLSRSILRNASGLERDINDMFMRVAGDIDSPFEDSVGRWDITTPTPAVESKARIGQQDASISQPAAEVPIDLKQSILGADEAKAAKLIDDAHMHLGTRIHDSTDYTKRAAELQATWEYIRSHMDAVKALRSGHEGATEPEDMLEWDPRIKQWMFNKQEGEIEHYDVFARLKALEEADTDNAKLTALAKSVGMKTGELKEGMKEPLQWHRIMAHLIDDISVNTARPPMATEENLQRLGRDEDMPLGDFAGRVESKDQIDAGMPTPKGERYWAGDEFAPPLLKYVYAMNEKGRSKALVEKVRIKVKGKMKEVTRPVTAPWSWQGGALAGEKRQWTDRPPEDRVSTRWPGLASARVIDPATGGRLLLTNMMLQRYQMRFLRQGPREVKGGGDEKEFSPAVLHPPHVRQDRKTLGYNQDIEEAIEANVKMHSGALIRRTHNAYGQPASNQAGFIQPYEVSPLLMIALQYGFPQHMRSDVDGKTFHGAGGWPLTDEGEPDYTKRDAMLQLFDHAMRGGDILPYYQNHEGEPLPPMSEMKRMVDSTHNPIAVPLIIDAVINHCHQPETWISMFHPHGDSDVPRGEDETWRAANIDIAKQYDQMKYDVLDAVINPRAWLRKIQAQLGISIGEDIIGEDGEITPGHITIKRKPQTSNNPTGGFERCRHCFKDGHINFDTLVTRGIASGRIDPLADRKEQKEGVAAMLESGDASFWGDADTWEEQHKNESPHLGRPVENVDITGLRFTCPDCDGLGICGGHHPERGSETLPDNLAHEYNAMMDKVLDYRDATAAASVVPISPGPAFILGESLAEYFDRNPEIDPRLTDDSGTLYNMASLFKSLGHDQTEGSFYGLNDMSYKEAVDAAVAAHAFTKGNEIKSRDFKEESERIGSRYRPPEPESEESEEIAQLRDAIRRAEAAVYNYRERDATHSERTYVNRRGVTKTKKAGEPPVWSDQHRRDSETPRREIAPLTEGERRAYGALRRTLNRMYDRLRFLNAGATSVDAAARAEELHQERMGMYEKQELPEPVEGRGKYSGYRAGSNPKLNSTYHGMDDKGRSYRWAVDKNKTFGTPSQWGLIGRGPHMLQYDKGTQEFIAHLKRMDAVKSQLWWDEDMSEQERALLEKRYTEMLAEQDEKYKKAPFNIDFEAHFNTAEEYMRIMRDPNTSESEYNIAALSLSMMPPLSRVMVSVPDTRKGKEGKFREQYLVFPRLDGATPAEVLGADYMKHHLGEDYEMVDWTESLREMRGQLDLHQRLTDMLQPVLDVAQRSGKPFDELHGMSTQEFNALVDELQVQDRYGAPVLGVVDTGGPSLMSYMQITCPTEEFRGALQALLSKAEADTTSDEEREKALEEIEKMKQSYSEGGEMETHIGLSYHPMLGLSGNKIDNILKMSGHQFTDRDGDGMQGHDISLAPTTTASVLTDMFHIKASPVDMNEISNLVEGFTPHRFAMGLASAVLHGESAVLPGYRGSEDGEWQHLRYDPSGEAGGTLAAMQKKTKVHFGKALREMMKWSPNTLLSMLRHGNLTHLGGKDAWPIRTQIEKAITMYHPGLDLGGERTDRNKWEEAIPLANQRQVAEAVRSQGESARLLNEAQESLDTTRDALQAQQAKAREMIASDVPQDQIEAQHYLIQGLAQSERDQMDWIEELKGQRKQQLRSTGDDEIAYEWGLHGDWEETESGDLERTVRFLEGGFQDEDKDFAELESVEEPTGIVPRFMQETYEDAGGNTRTRLVPNKNFDEEREKLSNAIESASLPWEGQKAGGVLAPSQFPFSPQEMANSAKGAGAGTLTPTTTFSAPPAGSSLPMAPSRVSVQGRIIPQEEWLDPAYNVPTNPPLPTIGSIVDGKKYTEEDRVRDLRAAIDRGRGVRRKDNGELEDGSPMPLKFALDGPEVPAAPHQLYGPGPPTEDRPKGTYTGPEAGGTGYWHIDAINARMRTPDAEDDIIETSFKTGDPLRDAMAILKILS